jgi:hypothetical protein
LTYAAEAAIPLLVLGLYAVQRPRIGSLGLLGAVAYSYAYVYFTGTVVFALEAHPTDFGDLNEQVAPWMTVHGAVMLIGGICFGLATARAGVLPRWIGYALVAAVCLVTATATAPDLVRTASALARAAVFVALGIATLRTTLHSSNASRTGSERPGLRFVSNILRWLLLLSAGVLSLPLAASFLDEQGTENWILPVQLGTMALLGALVGVAVPRFTRSTTRRQAAVGAAYGVAAAAVGILVFFLLLSGFDRA